MRSIAVFNRHRRRFVGALLLVPLLVAAATVLLNRSTEVTARIWALQPTFLNDPVATNQYTNQVAQPLATLLQELAGTDSFVDQVLLRAQPGYAAADTDQRANERSRFRRNLAVAVSGDHVAVLSYRSDQPEVGVRVVNEILRAFSSRAPALELAQASLSDSITTAWMRNARSLVTRSFGALVKTGALARPASGAVSAMPAPTADRDARRNQYQNLVGKPDPSVLSGTAAPRLQPAVFQVIDPPAVAAPSSPLALAARPIALSLLGTAALELALIYLIARADGAGRSAAGSRVAAADEQRVRPLRLLSQP